jgi:hypothetical protein
MLSNVIYGVLFVMVFIGVVARIIRSKGHR